VVDGVHPILYDRDCGFCRACLALVLRWDTAGRLRPVALQDEEADRLLAGMPEEERMASWHLVEPDGQVHSAGAAFAPLLRLLPRGHTLLPLFDRFPKAAERGYRLVADNRGVLGRLVTERARRRADERIERHTRAGPGDLSDG
jgi:predicted DCC family thiol-disulfide oxidoreductase YuxK